jgi:glucose-1-phosphate thymidylyltransferase
VNAAAPPRELIGLFPAAGRATRLGAAPGSKEILPVGTTRTPEGERPRLVCENLLEAFIAAGCARVLVLRRAEKRDLEDVLGDGGRFGLRLEHVVVPPTRSVPETLDRAYERIRSADVALGFPDVLARPTHGLARAVVRRRTGGADVVLALFPTDRPHKCDMVDVDSEGNVRGIEIKPASTALALTWLFATWGTRFTELLHGRAATSPPAGRELAVSDLLLEAMERGLRVEAIVLPRGSHLDIGTPDDLERARRGMGA